MAPSAPAAIDAACRVWLLRRARQAIAHQLCRQPLLPPEDIPLAAHHLCGCFVTLQTLSGRLRGSVGVLERNAPLWQQVDQAAVGAAVSDLRFAPLEPGDLEGVVVEISVLLAPQTPRPESLVVGRHGLAVRAGATQAVLLPQVASSYGWSAQTFLEQACMKVGLSPHAWQEPQTDISAFVAEVFTENARLT